MKSAVLLISALALLTPPSGRPPTGPLQRYDPKLYDLTYDVTLSTDVVPYKPEVPNEPGRRILPDYGGTFRLEDTPIVMPLIFQGAYSRVDHESLGAELYLANRRVPNVQQQSRIDDGFPHHTHMAVIPIGKFTGQTLRWNLSYRVQSWSARLDDRAAAQIPWPREWPEEVRDGLQPQLFIESDDPIFAQTVQRVSQGQLRLVPPYLAAKDLVRYCINELQISGDGQFRGRFGILHGMEVIGAKQAAVAGRGGPHDLVCVCVAMLRAANIPARPVIGVREDAQKRGEFVSWAEFYLPGAGWVPFSPDEMRGQALQNRDVRQPWPEFGTMKDLNDCIPLAYHFIPPKTVESPMYPAVWGWDPRPGKAPAAEQRISISIVSRGKGVEDPR